MPVARSRAASRAGDPMLRACSRAEARAASAAALVTGHGVRLREAQLDQRDPRGVVRPDRQHLPGSRDPSDGLVPVPASQSRLAEVELAVAGVDLTPSHAGPQVQPLGLANEGLALGQSLAPDVQLTEDATTSRFLVGVGVGFGEQAQGHRVVAGLDRHLRALVSGDGRRRVVSEDRGRVAVPAEPDERGSAQHHVRLRQCRSQWCGHPSWSRRWRVRAYCPVSRALVARSWFAIGR